MPKPFVKPQEAKDAISFPGFHSDDLLEIALTDPCTLNEMGLSPQEQAQLKGKYRRLAYLGDSIIDAVLADYLYRHRPELSHEDFDDYRQELVDRLALGNFAIDLGLHLFSSSWNRVNRKSPSEEPGVWGEMFEAVVGVLFLDANRDFNKIAQWLCDRFIHDAVAAYEDSADEDDQYDDFTVVTSEDYAEMLGLPRSSGISFS